MKTTLLALLGLLAQAPANPPASARKPPATAPAPKPKPDEYDPDKLGPAERACGRPGSKRSQPCQCRRIREEKAEKELRACAERFPLDRAARMACQKAVPECHEIQVRDSEHWYTNEDSDAAMPIECSRSCSKARCECCHT